MLYPYRASSVKNRERFNWGVLYPEAYSSRQTGADLCEMRTECLVAGGATAGLEVKVRFLHLVVRTDGGAAPWQEAREREVTVAVGAVGELVTDPKLTRFTFPADDQAEGEVRRRQERLDGEIVISACLVAPDVHRITTLVANATAWGPTGETARNDVTAALPGVDSHHPPRRGRRVRLAPRSTVRAAGAGGGSAGMWGPGRCWPGTMARATRCSPRRSSSTTYPRIAPESAGDLFDATEIDEILSLRILTLTDEEKREIRETDERARQLLERTESLGAEQLMRLHGTLRP